MTVDRKSSPRNPDSQASQRTFGKWYVRPPTAQNPSRVAVTALSGFVEIYDAPLTLETAANARLIANAPDLEDALRELMDADAELERATSSTVSRQRAAHERWVLARAVAFQVLSRISGQSSSVAPEPATFVGNSLCNRPVNEAARSMRNGGGA